MHTNAHQRRNNDYLTVPPKYKSRLVGCGNFETTEGLRTDSLRTDSPAADVDSHNIVCSWCAQAHISLRCCGFTNGYFQGRETDRLLYRKSAGGGPEDGQEERSPLKETCQASSFSLNLLLQTLFTLRNDESEIIAVTSSNV